jgi:diaminopropionate ammonia-lyase
MTCDAGGITTMKALGNTWRGRGLPAQTGLAAESVSRNTEAARTLFESCPEARETPLLDRPDLARQLAIASLAVKDERGRMGLGSFKALGAAYAIAKQADLRVKEGLATSLQTALEGMTFVCASAGNHGLSLAAGAPLFGARAAVFVSETVPEAFAVRLERKGAEVIRAGQTYEESMTAARQQAEANGWQLLPDSTWPGMTEPGRDVMEGYLVMGAEIARQIDAPPTHVFLQAGVGGLAAACAVSARASWGDDVTIVVVEPEDAPALQASIAAGHPVTAPGAVSIMGRLDCKEPSHLALKLLAEEADLFVTVSDAEAEATVALLAAADLATTPSGAAGLAALHHAGTDRAVLGLTETSRVLCYLSEGPESG